MRKFITFLLIVTLAAAPVIAATPDNDGQLGAAWNAPTTGNPPVSYFLSYTVNGVADSVTLMIPATSLKDSSVVLQSVGHWALLDISSIDQFGNTSAPAQSDTVMYDIGTVVPPTGIRWE